MLKDDIYLLEGVKARLCTVVRGRFAVPIQTSSISLFIRYSNQNYMSLDSQRIMLNHDIHDVVVGNEIEV